MTQKNKNLIILKICSYTKIKGIKGISETLKILKKIEPII